MDIHWIRFALAVVGSFLAYGLVYAVILPFMPGAESFAAIARTPDDPAAAWTMIGHFVETLVIVFLYFVFIKTRDLRQASLYGLAIGVYYTATTWSMMGSVAAIPSEFTFSYMPVHVLAAWFGAGLVPALLYPPEAVNADAGAVAGSP